MDPETVTKLAADLDERFGHQIGFILEIDKLKSVERRSRLSDGSRYENTAEHSWHLALAVLVLADRAGPDVDIGRAVTMLLVHDLVEIDAGDTYIYDPEAMAGKADTERVAADRIFGILPGDIAGPLRAAWEEYEARDTPTARFAYAVDRLQPMLLNAASGGRSWHDHGIRADQVVAMCQEIEQGSPLLWDLGLAVIDTAVADGALAPGRD